MNVNYANYPDNPNSPNNPNHAQLHHSRHALRAWRRRIGGNIYAWRCRRRMPLARLARLAEVNAQRLDYFEIGRDEINLNDLFRIACALNVDAAALMAE